MHTSRGCARRLGSSASPAWQPRSSGRGPRTLPAHVTAFRLRALCCARAGFGKTYADVAGRPFSSLVRDQDVIMKLLERAQAASEEDFSNGLVKESSMYILHQYLDPVEVRAREVNVLCVGVGVGL